MTQRWRGFLWSCTVLFVLAWAGFVLAQNSPGGAFLTGFDYIIGGQWRWRSEASPFIFEGTTDDTFEQTLTVTNPTADGTTTLGNATGHVVQAEDGLTASGIRSGIAFFDGSNPTSITTGLTTVLSCDVTPVESVAPGDDWAFFTILTTAEAGRLDVYEWAHTSGTDPTLVAGTRQVQFGWWCVGTP